MGGGGWSGGPMPVDIKHKIEQAQQKERERLDSDVNRFLGELLAHFNKRDRESVSKRLDEIAELLGAEAEIQQILLAGSVAKHTAITGISDVDALVLLNREDWAGKGPAEVLSVFERELYVHMRRSNVESVKKGHLAVTVKYKDGLEIQLLPALRSRQTISVADTDGKKWRETRPEVFQRKLTKANKKLGDNLVPAIKLVKSIVHDFPNDKQIGGYHTEALALDAAKGYDGPKTAKALVLHVLDHASKRVLKPIADVTGQSPTVDADLGKANSMPRRSISQALMGMKRRLETATTVEQWKYVFLAGD